MDVIKLNKDNIRFIDNLSAAIGQFDGLHIAHLELINKAIYIAGNKSLKSAIITFDPHPDFVLKKQIEETYITPIEEKIKLIETFNVDYLVIINFTKEVAGTNPKDFVNDYLVNVGVKEIVCGFDFSFGKFGKGKGTSISEYSNGLINTTIIDEIKFDNKKIGSTLIRELLMSGDVSKVKEIMGRFYSVTAKVIRGSQIGKKVGVPTANLEINSDFVDVKSGVYSVLVHHDNKKFLGICNIGHNPTFNYQANKRIEVHILNFNKDIYEEELVVEFLEFLRNESKFESIEAFQTQIKRDIENTLKYKELI